MNKRDPSATKERILKSGITEFGAQGFGGARTEAIAERAGCNIRMLYHYFGGKQALYVACLDRVYSNMRDQEKELNLLSLTPDEAIGRLVDFTFDHMSDNPDFVRLCGVENTQGGKFLESLPHLSNTAVDLVQTVEDVLKEGVNQQVLKSDIDAFQLYISIISLSYFHISNKFTLGISYGKDMSDAEWLALRRQHVRDVILSFVKQS